MDNSARDFLHSLLATPSPSGFEQKIQSLVRARLAEVAESVTTDVHGNVMGVLNRGGSPRVMVVGHCDEVGLMITHIDERGFCYFDRIGGPDPACMLGQRVRVQTRDGEVIGVIGKKPIHLEKPEERGKGVKVDDLTSLFIDVGAKDEKDATKNLKIRVGDPAVYDVGVVQLANGRFACRAADDRVGAFVACEVLAALAAGAAGKKKDRALNAEVWAVASVQEELGTRGAQTASFSIDPAVGFAVDVGFATDFPSMDPKAYGVVKLGKGPILGRGGNFNPVLGELLAKTADKHKIKSQTVAEPRIPGTDARPMQVNMRGVATAVVGIPNRYMHTPVEMISYDDLDSAVALIAETIRAMDRDHDFTPR